MFDSANSRRCERRRQTPRALRGLFAVAVGMALLIGYCVAQQRQAADHPLRPLEVRGEWLKVAGDGEYSGHFRRHLHLPSTVVNAWIAVAACDGFEVTVNDDPVARQFVWRPTRPFQNGSSEKGQRLTQANPAIGLNFPREYQWTGFESHRLPTFVDIRPELRRGDNVLCVQIEARAPDAKFALVGEIQLASGQRISLGSSVDWRGATVPPKNQELLWSHPDYDDTDWQPATTATPPVGSLWRSFSSEIFSTAFAGKWMEHPTASAGDAVVFSRAWELSEAPDEAWLRLATNRYFDLFVNGTRVSARQSFAPDLDSGQWVMSRHRSIDPQDRPAVLDPDELDSPFEGHRFEQPPSSDPTDNDFRSWANSSSELRFGQHLEKTPFARKFGGVRSQQQLSAGHPGPISYPASVGPQSHQGNAQLSGYVGYDISRLLRRGHNRLEVRLAEPDTVTSTHWLGRLAVDGSVFSGGKHINMSHDGWRVCQLPGGEWAKPVESGPVRRALLPRLQYRGVAASAPRTLQQVTVCQITSVLVVAIVLTTIIVFAYFWSGRDAGLVADVARMLFAASLAASVTLAGGLLLRCCFAERFEALWFFQPTAWSQLFAASSVVALVAAWRDVQGRTIGADSPVQRYSLRRLPKTAYWPLILGLVLIAAFWVRAYRVDFQPLDDDEYASTQAILAIAETGLPKFAAEGVWYTRSPLFHYSMGALATLFGANLWVLRLPSVLLGVATCWLTYWMGSRLLKSPWVGLAAMVLLAIHPFQVFTAHVVRFYQMQQFFALLTIYWFCKGFVTGQSLKYRYLTVFGFLCTVLSQEASCIIGFSLLLGYLLFAEEKSWSSNVRLVIAAVCALVLISVDYFVFQARCMTRVAGISPNLEAKVALHFWHPYNFMAMLVSYSRLHIVASCFLLLGLPLVCRERQRNAMALYVILGSGVVFTNLLVTHISLRYQYWLIPIWALLCMEGLRAVVQRLCAYGLDMRNEPHRHYRLVQVVAFSLFIACVCSFSPWRILGSHKQKLLGDSTGAMRYISRHRRPHDRIMVTEPHTHAALIETGGVDYDLSVPLLYDFAVMQDGRLVDRNGGAEVVGNLQGLMNVMQENDRMWIAVNREKIRNRGKNLRWEYPGARVDLFLRKNCTLVYKNYLWSVFLWDAQDGQYVPFRQRRL